MNKVESSGKWRNTIKWQARARCSTKLLIFLTLSLVALADFLFMPCMGLGLNFAVFLAAILVALVLRARFSKIDAPTLGIGAFTLCLVPAVMIEPTPLAQALTFLVLPGVALSLREGFSLSGNTWCKRYFSFICQILLRFHADAALLIRRFIKGKNKHLRLCSVSAASAWALPIVLSLIFISLFSSANPIISSALTALTEYADHWIVHFIDMLNPERVLFWICWTLIIWAFLRMRTRGTKIATVKKEKLPLLESAMVSRCLTMFNLIFLIQTLSDLCYLFMGVSLPKGMTYAAYAHRGAYPLLFATLLAAFFVLLAFGAKSKAQEWMRARKLVYLWIGQNILLTFSSIYRLLLYIEAYGLSRWRIAAVIWMGLIAFGFAAILIRIFAGRTNLWLTGINSIALGAALLGCCYLNIDRFIARYNVTHSRDFAVGIESDGFMLDYAYLEGMGADALPAMCMLYQNTNNVSTRYKLETSIKNLATALKQSMVNWRSVSIRRLLIERELRQLNCYRQFIQWQQIKSDYNDREDLPY